MYHFILAFTSINILFSPNVVPTNVNLLYCANDWACHPQQKELQPVRLLMGNFSNRAEIYIIRGTVKIERK